MTLLNYQVEGTKGAHTPQPQGLFIKSITSLQPLHQGILYMLISALCLSLMSVLVKILSPHLPTIELVFFRNSIGIIFLALTLLKSPIDQVGGKPWLLVFRATVGFLAMLSFFYNIAHTSLANAVTYSRMAPIFTALLAYWFLKEHIHFRGWLAIVLGCVGMLFVMQPQWMALEATHLFGLSNAFFAALAFTSIRELRKYYSVRVIVSSFLIIGTVMPLLFMIIAHFYTSERFVFLLSQFVMPEPKHWIYIVAMAVLSLLGQTFMTKAYGITKAGIIGTVGYSVILFSLLIGLVLGDSLPNLLGFMGIGAIVVSGVVIARAK